MNVSFLTPKKSLDCNNNYPNTLSTALGIALAILWLVPLIWNGFSKELPPGTPALAAPYYRTSGMFEQSPENIRIYYVYVKNGSGSWNEIPDDLLAGYPLMGKRSRLQLILGSLRRPKDFDERQRFAEWIADSLNKKQRRTPAAECVRFLVDTRNFMQHPVQGAWKKPEADPGLINDPEALLSEHRIQGK